MVDWYEQHIGNVPDDLLTMFLSGSSSAVASASNAEDATAAAAAAAEAQSLDLEQTLVALRREIARDIAGLKRLPSGDTRRGVLLRHVQKTGDSICKHENTLATLRRDQVDAIALGRVCQRGTRDPRAYDRHPQRHAQPCRRRN
jgi:hypothetical protein